MAARRRTDGSVRFRRHSSKAPECQGNPAVLDRGKPEKPLVKIEISGKAGCVPVNPDPMVVYLDDVYRHVLTSLFRNASSASAPYKGEREQTRRALSPSRTF